MADHPKASLPHSAASPSTRQLLDELDALMQRMLALPVQQADDKPSGQPPRPTSMPVVSSPRNVGLMPPAPVTVQAPAPAQFVVGPQTPPAQAQPPQSRQHLPRGEKPQARFDEFSDFAEPEAAPTYLPIGAEPLLPVLLQPPKPAHSSRPQPPNPPPQPPRPAPEAAAKQPGAGEAKAAAAPRPEALPAPRPIWLKTAPTSAAPAPTLKPGLAVQLLIAVNRLFDGGTSLFGFAGGWLRSRPGRFLLGWSGLAMIAAAAIWAAWQFLS